MKKYFISFIVLMCAAVFFAEEGATKKYRYGMLDESVGITIIDLPQALPDESIDNVYVVPLNTVEERFVAAYGYDNLKQYFYDGSLNLFYVDGTKGEEPNIEVIYSWADFMEYITGDR